MLNNVFNTSTAHISEMKFQREKIFYSAKVESKICTIANNGISVILEIDTDDDL